MIPRRALSRIVAGAALALACGTATAREPPTRDVLAYEIDLTVYPSSGRLRATSIVHLPPAQRGESVPFVLGASYRVTEAGEGDAFDVAIEPAKEDAPLQTATITFRDSVERPQLRLSYEGELNATGTPPINAISPALVELSVDSFWLPIRADFGAKLTVDARIRGLPDDCTFVSPGTASREGQVMRVRRPVPDVDLAFACIPRLVQSRVGDLVFHATRPDAPQPATYRRHAVAAIDFLQSKLGPMPNAPVKLVVIERPRKSGYARRGYVVVTAGTPAPEAGTAKFLAHEFAHAWFSNANTNSEHRWIDESLAEYVALRYVGSALGVAAADALYAKKRDAAATARAVVGTARADAELYDKGPLLLRELERDIGAAAMDELLRIVATEHIGSTAAFIAALSRIAGPDEAAAFEAALGAE